MILTITGWIRACGWIGWTIVHQNHPEALINQDLLRFAGRLGIAGRRGSAGGGDRRVEAIGGWRRSAGGGDRRVEAIGGWRRSAGGGDRPVARGSAVARVDQRPGAGV